MTYQEAKEELLKCSDSPLNTFRVVEGWAMTDPLLHAAFHKFQKLPTDGEKAMAICGVLTLGILQFKEIVKAQAEQLANLEAKLLKTRERD